MQGSIITHTKTKDKHKDRDKDKYKHISCIPLHHDS